MNIYGYQWHPNIADLQNLGEPALNDMVIAEKYQDLESCRESMIFVSPEDANTHFELTKKLIAQNNYLIFLHLSETITSVSAINDLFDDLPAAKRFPGIYASAGHTDTHFGTESFLFRIHTHHNTLCASKISENTKINRPFKFLYLNGRHSDHRQQLWRDLESLNLLKYGLNSYLGYQPNNLRTDLVTENSISTTFLPAQYESHHVSRKHLITDHSTSARPYLNHKFDYFPTDHWIDGYLSPVNRYIDTYFSVVTETLVESDYLFVTEKTFKVLMAGHPFVILGMPGTYEYIKSLGFKTYGTIIDESFDGEVNWQIRKSRIVKEIQKLCQCNLDHFITKCNDINLHNQEIYKQIASRRYKQIYYEFTTWLESRLIDAKNYIRSLQ